jgi:hypothetical protein
VRETVNGDFVTSLVCALNQFRELQNLSTNDEKGGLLVNAIQVVIKLRAEASGTVIVGKTPVALLALEDIIGASAATEGPVAVWIRSRSRVDGRTICKGNHRSSSDLGIIQTSNPLRLRNGHRARSGVSLLPDESASRNVAIITAN